MHTTLFRNSFLDGIAQRVRVVLFTVAAGAVTAVQLLAGAPNSTPVQTMGTAFVVLDATLTPVALRCPSVGC